MPSVQYFDLKIQPDMYSFQHDALNHIHVLCMFLLFQVTRKEYRGQRSIDAFSNYIRNQMQSRIQEFHALSDLNVDVSSPRC